MASSSVSTVLRFFPHDASMTSENEKSEERTVKLKTPVEDGEQGKPSLLGLSEKCSTFRHASLKSIKRVSTGPADT